jgi:N-acetylglucosamine kinase-like BadF-type ATPase
MTEPSASPGSSAADSSRSGDFVLGVDGGGTKTEAWIARCTRLGKSEEPEVIGRGKAGPSNPRAVGFDAAMENLQAAVDASWRDAGIESRPARRAVLAISGSGHVDMRDRIVAWADANGLAEQTSVVHDADPVLAAGAGGGRGVALIVGTGSAAIAADGEGGRAVVGGWGYWFGDEGSAYWIGRLAMEAVARAADGRAPATALTGLIASRMQTDDPRAMLTALEQTCNVRDAIAALASTVGEAANAGDAAATAIVESAASELAQMVECAAAKLNLGSNFPLALTGGVACGSELLRERLLAALAARSITPAPVEVVPHPAAGCVRLALGLLRS